MFLGDKDLVIAQTQLRLYSEQHGAFGIRNISYHLSEETYFYDRSLNMYTIKNHETQIQMITCL